MSFKKRTSPTLDKARERANNLATIRPDLTLGKLTLAEYQAKIAAAQTMLTAYNGLLTEADMTSDKFDGLETELKDWNERMLTGIATEYGKDSAEYEAAGGTRKSERNKPKRKAA